MFRAFLRRHLLLKEVALFCWRLWHKGLETTLEFSPTRLLRKRRVKIAKETNRLFIARIHPIRCKFVIDPDTYFSQVYVRGSYEPKVVKYLLRILKPGMTCVDVGANVGYFSLLMAKCVGADGRVIAFEPTQHSLNLLHKNVHLNGLTNVLIEQIALFDHEGILTFHEGPPGYEVYNSAGEISHPSAIGQEFVTSFVQCTTLDSYLSSRGLHNVDIVKIDVEGAEIFVLNGMEKTLEANPKAVILTEVTDTTTAGFGYSSRDIELWFTERGWRLAVPDCRRRLVPVTVGQGWKREMLVAYRS